MNPASAGVAELADAYGSGPYGGNPMKVQVLSPAPLNERAPSNGGFFVMAHRGDLNLRRSERQENAERF